jgi:DNA-binding response OmpR family regulator
MRVLVVEDDPHLADDIARALSAAGYVVDRVRDGEEAWFRADTEDYAAIVLDLGLPKVDGLTVLKRLRQGGNRTPILVLTARGSWSERVEGIDAGADDYMPKPFRIEELLARLRAIMRRAVGLATSVHEIGDVVLDERQSRVSVRGTPASLTPLEYRLLAYLVRHRGRLVTQVELTDHIYAQDYPRDSNAIEALVARVRKKVGAATIETRRGFGYIVPGGAV